MSETAAPDTLPGFETRKSEVSNLGGKTRQTTIVQWGPPEKRRYIEFREVKLSDQWKVSRIAGSDPSPTWRMMTLIALTLEQIDKAPLPTPHANIDLREIEDRLDRLGEDGLEAVLRASERPTVGEADADDPEAAHRAQAGNSPMTPASAA